MGAVIHCHKCKHVPPLPLLCQLVMHTLHRTIQNWSCSSAVLHWIHVLPPCKCYDGHHQGHAPSICKYFLQEMGFDSIPFEEPELFRARIGLEASDRLADRQASMLHLRLDSQDDLGSSLAEVGIELPASCYCTATCRCLAAPPPSPNSYFLCAWCTACVNLSGGTCMFR